jgi:D-sedoheptulose 7-phosphate isomerase
LTEALTASVALKTSILADEDVMAASAKAADLCVTAFQSGRKVLFCGNGGSAADAQHLAAELSGRFAFDRPALPSDALHCNTSYLTAVANDYSFEEVYGRLVLGLGQPGDVLIGLSTSGKSRNIVRAFEAAKQKQMTTVAFTGQGGGFLGPLSDVLVAIPSRETPRIQECHMLIGHVLCQIIERTLFTENA